MQWAHHSYIGLVKFNFYKYLGHYANLDPETYGFCPLRAMGYGLSWTYGLWCENPCPPTRWTQKGMGFQGLWVIRSMGYKGFDCRTVECSFLNRFAQKKLQNFQRIFLCMLVTKKTHENPWVTHAIP